MTHTIKPSTRPPKKIPVFFFSNKFLSSQKYYVPTFDVRIVRRFQCRTWCTIGVQSSDATRRVAIRTSWDTIFLWTRRLATFGFRDAETRNLRSFPLTSSADSTSSAASILRSTVGLQRLTKGSLQDPFPPWTCQVIENILKTIVLTVIPDPDDRNRSKFYVSFLWSMMRRNASIFNVSTSNERYLNSGGFKFES